VSVATRGRLLWWITFIGAQAIIVFALLELVLRVFHPVPIRVRGNEIVLPVKQVYRFDNGLTRKIDRMTIVTKNAIGFRGPDPPSDFATHLTIVTIGGSTTECLFLSDGRTWTDVLARRLASDFPDVWVNNAGMDGQSTYGHLVLLRAFVTRLQPKVALFLIGLNDVTWAHPSSFDESLAPDVRGVRRVANAMADRSEVVSTVWNVLRSARARQRGLGHFEIDFAAAPHLVLDADAQERALADNRATLPGYAARLAEIIDLTRGHGIEPIFVTQPAVYGDVVDPTTGRDLTFVKINGRGNGHLEWRLLEMTNDVTRRVAAERGVFLVDLAREMEKDSRYYYDFVHFTNEGAERVGEIVARHLAPHLHERRTKN
jgi:lysophospholipase L1-like esterase